MSHLLMLFNTMQRVESLNNVYLNISFRSLTWLSGYLLAFVSSRKARAYAIGPAFTWGKNMQLRCREEAAYCNFLLCSKDWGLASGNQTCAKNITSFVLLPGWDLKSFTVEKGAGQPCTNCIPLLAFESPHLVNNPESCTFEDILMRVQEIHAPLTIPNFSN